MITASERIFIMRRGPHLIPHAETQVAQHDVVGPYGHAEACNADAVAGGALPGDRHVAAP